MIPPPLPASCPSTGSVPLFPEFTSGTHVLLTLHHLLLSPCFLYASAASQLSLLESSAAVPKHQPHAQLVKICMFPREREWLAIVRF